MYSSRYIIYKTCLSRLEESGKWDVTWHTTVTQQTQLLSEKTGR